MFFGLFRRKEKKEGSRKDAKDRLQAIVSGRRHSVPVREVISHDVVGTPDKDMLSQIKRYVAQRFKVEEENVRVQLEEHNGYVVIITNVVFH